jgi:hypothetical protein
MESNFSSSSPFYCNLCKHDYKIKKQYNRHLKLKKHQVKKKKKKRKEMLIQILFCEYIMKYFFCFKRIILKFLKIWKMDQLVLVLMKIIILLLVFHQKMIILQQILLFLQVNNKKKKSKIF